MRHRHYQVLLIMIVILMAAPASLSLAAVPANPPQPTYLQGQETVVVDGDPSEWDLTTDFFSNMYENGDSSGAILGMLYLRYDCTANILYLLALVNPDPVFDPPLAMDITFPDAHRITLETNLLVDATAGFNPPDGEPPDLAWIWNADETVVGWEASAPVPAGTYFNLWVHARTWYNGESTSSKICCLDLVLECADLGRLDGHKFLDLNGNGAWDQPSEPPLEGWQIALNDGSVTTTGADGYYAFEGLVDGTYTVSEVCPETWVQTAPGFTDFITCGTITHTATIDVDHREVNNLDFGNGQPALDLVKDCPSDVFVGDVITYTVTVTNTGNVPLQGVAVSDPFLGLSELVDLGPGESETYLGSYDTTRPIARYAIYVPLVLLQGSSQPAASSHRAAAVSQNAVISNTATATSDYALVTLTATDTCVTNIHELEVHKDAQTSFTRTYLWTIDKTVDDLGPMTLLSGAMTTPNYTVTVDLQDPPYVDSDWAVEGTIVVQNPAPVDAELASVMDTVSPDLQAGVNCPALIVPAGGSLTCTYGPVPLLDGSNRLNLATVALKNNTGRTTEFGSKALVDFSQADIQLINDEIQVLDTFSDAPQELLGTVRYDQVPVSFVYSQVIQTTGDSCGLFPIPNTATLVSSDSSTTISDGADVQILELCEIAAAYEDLRREDPGLDWDYNDWVATINLQPTFSDGSSGGSLLGLDFAIVPEARGAAYNHVFHLRIPGNTFLCNGTSTLTLFDGAGDPIGVPDENPFNGLVGGDFAVIPWTLDALPAMTNTYDDASHPYVPTARTALLSLEFPAACPFDLADYDPNTDVHGENLFFEPYLHVDVKDPAKVDYDVRAGDDRTLIVPMDWTWPEERVGIWYAYLAVNEPAPAGVGQPLNPPSFDPQWWLGPTTDKLYDKKPI
ncbi:MAG TPA: SdrD B-like domain-containing protein [Anaerolineae bacterium]|nr:SdrD B-like domain-containing protein [Anaerolineae bacterium]